MYLSSKLATSRVLAVALAITLWGFGLPTLQAKQQGCCPAPVVREKPTVQCCPAPVLREKPSVPPAAACCPVDPKEVKKAQKEAEHAQHEAAEACQRQQKEVAKQQAKIDKAQAKAEHEIGEANAKVEARNAQWADANAEYASLTPETCPAETTAEVKQPEPEIERAKPIEQAPYVEPTPAPTIEPTPAPTPEAEAIIEVTPAPVEAPKALPKTASDMSLIGLVGLVSTMTGYMTRFFRS